MKKDKKSVHPKSDVRFQKAHDQLFGFCISLLKTANIVEPKLDDEGNDRTTSVILTPPQRKAAERASQIYHKQVGHFIESKSVLLSRCDTNLLLANEMEIKSYVLMKRWGQDVTRRMYRNFYKNELKDLIKQQVDISRLIMACRSAPGIARKQRHWAGADLTIGAEEEHQIVSNIDWGLTHDVDQLLPLTKSCQFSREVYKSQIEAKTPVCENIQDVRKHLTKLRQHLKEILPAELSVLSAGTHPFSTWNVQQANKTARTDLFMHDMQDSVRRLVTFGFHVHIGIEDKDLAVRVINIARSYLPLLLALSTSSPFWEGRDTGLFSFRSTVFSALPRTGIPPPFATYRDYEDYWNLLAKTNSFDSEGSRDPTKIWWDLRLHPRQPTIEFRICDACSTIDDAVCISALCQAITAKIIKLLHAGLELSVPPKHIIEENKWRAIRYGSRARFIDSNSKQEVTARYLVFQLLDFLEDVLPGLGSEREVRKVLDIVENGSSAYRQTRLYKELRGDANKRLMKVTEWLASRFVPNRLLNKGHFLQPAFPDDSI